MPKPVKIGTLTGSKRSKRRAKSEPTASPDAPEIPDWMDEDARACWSHTTAMLDGMGLLSRTDQGLLSRYCQAWSRWARAEHFLTSRGDTYALRDEKGAVRCLQQFPQVAIAHKLSMLLLRMEQDMGLTPAARARLASDRVGDRKDDIADEFFGGVPPLRIAQ